MLVEGICFLEESLLFITLDSFRERDWEERERERQGKGGREKDIYDSIDVYNIVDREREMIKSKLSDET